jgi:hypothetical protein
MRFSVIVVAAILVLPLAAAPANAWGAKAQAATADLSAQTKKPAKKAVKAKKEKVEYMRAAPMK